MSVCDCGAGMFVGATHSPGCNFMHLKELGDPSVTNAHPAIRRFDTGADRDVDDDKYDYDGFLSPLVLERFAAYMHTNRTRQDGTLRDGDNWQKGIPKDQYMKSGWRHFFDWWRTHRRIVKIGQVAELVHGHALEDALCGLLFNAMGYLHEMLKEREV